MNPNTMEPTEHVIDFNDLDLQKSVDMNTQRGFRFVLRPEPPEEYLRNQQNPTANPSQPPEQPNPIPVKAP
jgi:beta-galactosidase GanA